MEPHSNKQMYWQQNREIVWARVKVLQIIIHKFAKRNFTGITISHNCGKIGFLIQVFHKQEIGQNMLFLLICLLMYDKCKIVIDIQD